MKRVFTAVFVLSVFFLAGVTHLIAAGDANQNEDSHHYAIVNVDINLNVVNPEQEVPNASHSEDSEQAQAAGWAIFPFALLLLMIATGPLFYEHFWHKHYPKISVILALLIVVYYLLLLNNVHAPVHSFFEYFQFISLLASLYVASGGIMIQVDKKATPGANVLLLAIGAVIANMIGTTGASMLLIRPFIRLNKTRIKSYHIIFFIFIVSNIGGSLTPIGDPPLFLGFLKGVPFFWTLTHNLMPWIFGISFLLVVFYFVDRRNKSNYSIDDEPEEYTNKISMIGNRNFVWLAIIIMAVFLDPNVFEWIPAIQYDGVKFSFIRELIMLTVAYLSYRYANKEAIKGNEFNFEPIREVAFIFVGIFGTMMPALELVGNYAASPEGMKIINPDTLYWGTGILSGFLDNAPTYINFLTAAMASKGGDIGIFNNVTDFALGGVYEDSIMSLKAISVAAVFFGAMTYIGNGPNFMVKSIAEQIGIKMPSFFGYIIRFSIPILIPLFVMAWLIFFYYEVL